MSGTADHPVRDRGDEQLRVILKGYRERPDLLDDLLKRRSQCRAIRARRRASGLVDARPPERFPMAHRKAGEILTGGRGGDGFKRLERGGDASKQPLGFVKFPGMKRRARFAAVNVRGLATLELGKLGAKARQGRHETGRTPARTRAATNGPLQRRAAPPE